MMQSPIFSISRPASESRERSHPSTALVQDLLDGEELSPSTARSLLVDHLPHSPRRKRSRPVALVPEEIRHTSLSPTLEALHDTFVSKHDPKKPRISFKEPQPIVDVSVGKKEHGEIFHVYRVFLCRSSPLFMALLADGKTSITLEQFSATVFGYFIHWLYHEEIYDDTSGEKFPGYIILMDLWMFGHAFGVVELKNAVLDVMVARDNKIKILPDHVVVHLAWETVPRNSSFMKMLIDWFVLRAQLDGIGEVLGKFPKGLVQQIAVAAMFSPIRGSANVVGLIRRPAKYYHEKGTGK